MSRGHLVADLLFSSAVLLGCLGLFGYAAWALAAQPGRAAPAVVFGTLAALAGAGVAVCWAAHAAEWRRRGRAEPGAAPDRGGMR